MCLCSVCVVLCSSCLNLASVLRCVFLFVVLLCVLPLAGALILIVECVFAHAREAVLLGQNPTRASQLVVVVSRSKYKPKSGSMHN